jgi:hypothetical protein
VPQLIPAGLLVTVPLPLPDLAAVSVKAGWNVAVTARAWLMVTWHVPVPVQPSPLQPVKAEPAPAAAVSVTSVPAL